MASQINAYRSTQRQIVSDPVTPSLYISSTNRQLDDSGHFNKRGKLRTSNFLAVSIGIVYLLFGLLKFFPNLSPAEELAQDTILKLTLGVVQPEVSIIMLAVVETLIGLCLTLNVHRSMIGKIALGHIACTFTPLIFFPEQIFTIDPFSLTLVGQYILKNIVIACALISLPSVQFSRPGIKFL